MISADVLSQVDRYRDAFVSARPFKHLCIDSFFRPEVAERLLADFPVFDAKNALNEFGEVGRKAVVTDIANISPYYSEFYSYLLSSDFLAPISRMLGISDFIFDRQMYGGGTHENLHGQELDVHVDFNYDLDTKLHRRVNMLIYLNKEWEEEWGGAIELHSNPWDWENDEIESFGPAFNRCVLFETNERSWHGFKRVQLPERKRHLSRKCLSIYLYTKDRPQEEIVPEHATFYVQRPLPAHFRQGYTLTERDVVELRHLLKNRDTWLQHYQKMELEHSAVAGQYQELRSKFERWTRFLPGPLRGAVRSLARR